MTVTPGSEAALIEADYIVAERPSGLATTPGLEAVASIIEQTRGSRRDWAFEIGDVRADEFAAGARASSLAAAEVFCSANGIAHKQRRGPLVVTGHQPGLFHPGVWVKHLLVDRLSELLDATGLNLVVDSDVAADTGFDVPSFDRDGLRLSRQSLVALPGPDTPYESVQGPDEAQIEELVRHVLADLTTLPNPAPARAFERFAAALRTTRRDTQSLGASTTRARRAHEASLATTYFELPVSAQSRTDEFLAFFLEIAERIEEFHDVYNGALREYRATYEVRSPANPFPDLVVRDGLIETPFWLMDEMGVRATLYLKCEGALSMVCHANGCKVELRRGRLVDNIAELRRRRIQVRPKALVLTLFARMFVADLFIHGVGGAKYDRVTDAIISDFFNVEPPAYLAVTATLWLATGAEIQQVETVAELRQRLHALQHNPDRFVDDPSLSDGDRPQLSHLAERKAELVTAIGRAGADKKRLGTEIRDVNGRLAMLLRPVQAATRERMALAERAEQSRRVATHRDFPFCYWLPEDVVSVVDAALDTAEVAP